MSLISIVPVLLYQVNNKNMSSVSESSGDDSDDVMAFKCIACGNNDMKLTYYHSAKGDICKPCYTMKPALRQNKHVDKKKKKTKLVFTVVNPPKQ